ncbi:MAG: hypothetical protein E7299_04870 [Lachnospiraceae bacterium]|nr:hypothetical protein [Lachnospiraceae bacterium]
MANVKVEINYKGLLELFKNEQIKEKCISVANNVAQIAGEGYNVSNWTGPHRAGATVWCDSYDAIRDNMKNNTMLKALGASVPKNKIVVRK